MNKDLKNRIKTFIETARNSNHQYQEANELLDILGRKRGRQPGFKVVKKPVIESIAA